MSYSQPVTLLIPSVLSVSEETAPAYEAQLLLKGASRRRSYRLTRLTSTPLGSKNSKPSHKPMMDHHKQYFTYTFHAQDSQSSTKYRILTESSNDVRGRSCIDATRRRVGLHRILFVSFAASSQYRDSYLSGNRPRGHPCANQDHKS